MLVVDDEVRMVDLVTDYLHDSGFTTTAAHDGVEALEVARTRTADVIVLDLMLPGLSGLEVCRQVRAERIDVPILMLTARGAVPERVAGLEAGADDYLVKPFALEELVARVRALGRRAEPTDGRLVVGDVVLDAEEHRVWIAGEEQQLSRREFTLLETLLENAGRVVTRQRLFDALWQGEVDIASNAMDVHVSRVRARLERSGAVSITTVRGVGYRLESG